MQEETAQGCEHIRLRDSCPHCLNIQKQYYQKLKEVGWVDIENTSHALRPLLCWHSLKWKGINPSKKEQIENYYQKARDILHTYSFKSDLHRKIWELHSDGLSKKKIEKEIANTDQPYKRESIGLIINEIAEEIK